MHKWSALGLRSTKTKTCEKQQQQQHHHHNIITIVWIFEWNVVCIEPFALCVALWRLCHLIHFERCNDSQLRSSVQNIERAVAITVLKKWFCFNLRLTYNASFSKSSRNWNFVPHFIPTELLCTGLHNRSINFILYRLCSNKIGKRIHFAAPNLNYCKS